MLQTLWYYITFLIYLTCVVHSLLVYSMSCSTFLLLQEKFSDVVNWLKANAIKGGTAAESLGAEKKLVPEVKNNDSKIFQVKTGLVTPSTNASFTSSWSSGILSNNQSSGGVFSNSQSSGMFTSSPNSVLFSNSQSTGLFSKSQSSGLFSNNHSSSLSSVNQSTF